MEPQVFNPVIMAGGVGSRLWPLSRSAFPKQYQALVGSGEGTNSTMLQQTLLRLSGLQLGLNQLICNQDHRFLAAEQMRELGPVDIVLEPMGRNTTPAVIIAALRLQQAGRDEPMLVLSADHDISDVPPFHAALNSAHELAEAGYITTLGIKPSFACTGYGYIHLGDAVLGGFGVNSFVEKPSQTVAQGYSDSGAYLWNSGMFIVKPSVIILEALALCPALLNQCQLVLKTSEKDLDFIRLFATEFEQCESISIDYAIMEHTQKAVVVPVDCGWSDVGDFQSLWQVNTKDELGNVKQGDVMAIDSRNCFVKSDNRLVTVLGVENIAVVETKDAVLVAKLDQAQQVKQLVAALAGRKELSQQREVYRPWGSYDSIDSGPNYQVKRITVNPNSRLSLQRHQFRAEHWVVVQGQAKVHVDGIDHLLDTNDSIYIPVGAVHSLANETNEALYLIEVQSGSYLGEDDIERLEDVYGRH
jgi:mannose-1-phosphate guanylyltransferase